MEFEWDEGKRQRNLAKHGLDFADVGELDWSNATFVEDTRKDYGEQRYWAFGDWNGRPHFVAFVRRGELIRVISFRKANKKEIVRYGKKEA